MRLDAIGLLLNSFDGVSGVVGEIIKLSLGGRTNSGLNNGGRGGWSRIESIFTGETLRSGGAGLVVVIDGGLDGGAHLADNFDMVSLLFLSDEMGEIGGAGLVKHVGRVIGFGVKFITHRRAAGFDSLTFRINEAGEEGETMGGFFFGNVASTRSFNLAWGGDEDGGFALTGHPETVFGFEVVGKDGGEIGFHGLILFDGEGEDDKEEADWNRNDSEEGKNLEKTGGKHKTSKNNHKVDELSKSKRAEQFIVGFDVLGDLITCHGSILS